MRRLGAACSRRATVDPPNIQESERATAMPPTDQPIDQRYLVQQRKAGTSDKEVPVFARTMKSKEGVFEGVSFIRNKDKASIMTLDEANQVIAWAAKKPLAASYVTTIICKGQ
jgi:hypothetical protein